MFKSVYEFTKAFSIMFLLSGVFFLFKEMYVLACITIFSFFAIKFIDSDWAFDNFKFNNHNQVVIFVTFALIFINVFTIYQELRFSPLLNKVTHIDKANYVAYEDELYSILKPCVSAHNELVDKINENQEVSYDETKEVNSICYQTIEDIDNKVAPSTFPSEVNVLCERTKDDFKKMAVNLALYDYSSSDSQQGVSLRIKDNIDSALKNMAKIREIMHINQSIEDSKRSFIKL